MNVFSRTKIIGFFLCVVFLPLISLSGEVPSWLTKLRSVQLPIYDKEINAVTLFEETVSNVNADGKVTTTYTSAVKILSREGRKEAVAKQLYLMSSSKVREIKAWLIRSNGTTKEYDKNTILDIISDPDDIYNEYRVKIIDGSDDVDTGAIFAYQTVVEESPLFNQDLVFFQSDLPVVNARYVLNLPTNWVAQGFPFNIKLEPQVNGSSYTWEVSNLPAISFEPASPSFRNLAPHLAVNYFPKEGGAKFKSFKDWEEVSRWHTELSDASVVVDDAVALKARELTANAKTEIEKIYAIGTFAQNLQYISIDVGVGRGNGYRPRPSNLVLSRGYGDCKDKANLMRALLKSLKIESYLVSIYSSDANFVRSEWASPRQFNHCIIAIKISDETKSSSVINHPKLGRLLIFDATDEFTPVGDLPEYLQGSLALIVAGDDGKLMQMPVTPPEANKLERQTELTLDAFGNLSGVIRERSIGQSAAYERRLNRSLSPADYNKVIENWIVNGISTARLSKISPVDKKVDGRFELDIEFKAPAYAQLMQGNLMVFKPAVISRLNSLFLTEEKRKHPVVLDSNAFTETSVIKLPEGFVVDETPEPLKLETPFGKYSNSYEIKENKLLFTRTLILNSTKVNVDKYQTVKDFFVRIRNAEQSPVVLAKK